MRLSYADKRRNITKKEASIVQNDMVASQLCTLFYKLENTLYQNSKFLYMNYSVEFL